MFSGTTMHSVTLSLPGDEICSTKWQQLSCCVHHQRFFQASRLSEERLLQFYGPQLNIKLFHPCWRVRWELFYFTREFMFRKLLQITVDTIRVGFPLCSMSVSKQLDFFLPMNRGLHPDVTPLRGVSFLPVWPLCSKIQICLLSPPHTAVATPLRCTDSVYISKEQKLSIWSLLSNACICPAKPCSKHGLEPSDHQPLNSVLPTIKVSLFLSCHVLLIPLFDPWFHCCVQINPWLFQALGRRLRTGTPPVGEGDVMWYRACSTGSMWQLKLHPTLHSTDDEVFLTSHFVPLFNHPQDSCQGRWGAQILVCFFSACVLVPATEAGTKHLTQGKMEQNFIHPGLHCPGVADAWLSLSCPSFNQIAI